MDESRKLYPYCLYQKRIDVDAKQPINTSQTVNSSSESYPPSNLKPFQFIELIHEMESYVMVPTRIKDIPADIESMPSFLADDTRTVYDVYKALIKIKSSLIELMANKVVADDQETSATDVLNSLEETGKYEAVMTWLKDHPEYVPGHEDEWSSPSTSEGKDGHETESVTSTASRMEELPADHVSHILEIMQNFSEKLSRTTKYVIESYRKAFDLPDDDDDYPLIFS